MTQTLSTSARSGALLLCLVVLAACSDMTPKQQRMLSGAAIGTTAGAIGTAMTGGCVSCGAAIGGAVGAGSGYLYDYISEQEW